jgi:hypothetical protein
VLDHACGPSKKESKAPVDKISIHNLLHEEEHNPLLGGYEEGIIRHVHLPANNMKWVEASPFQIAARHLTRSESDMLSTGSHSNILS